MNIEYNSREPIPAECLTGLSLKNNWYVKEIMIKTGNSTGGCFSAGYKVIKNNKCAYLKAFDFSSAFEESDIPRALEAQTSAYNFERDLLEKCKTKHLSKIVVPIDSGSIEVPNCNKYIGTVYYIIFELADGDIRTVYEKFDKLSLAFIFRSLHNIAVGINQLHNIHIAHQDIKPSNALVFNLETKLSDLGRASDKNKPFFYDDYMIPGDRSYAPLEQLYNFRAYNDFSDKYAADMYTFGNLFFFYFAGTSISNLFRIKVQKNKLVLTNIFEKDLPIWERIYDDIIIEFEDTIKNKFDENITKKVMEIVIALCHPDPRKRGHRKNRAQGFLQYDMQRYITELDILAKKAEFKLMK